MNANPEILEVEILQGDNPPARVRVHQDADGALIVHTRPRGQERTYPLVMIAACQSRGLDPLAVKNAGLPRECLGRLGWNEGNVEIRVIH